MTTKLPIAFEFDCKPFNAGHLYYAYMDQRDSSGYVRMTYSADNYAVRTCSDDKEFYVETEQDIIDLINSGHRRIVRVLCEDLIVQVDDLL